MGADIKLSGGEIMEIALESGLQLIPVIGGSISTLYFGTKQAKQYKRLEEFYNGVNSRLSLLENRISPIDEHYSDGLMSLIEQLNDKVEKEHQSKKVECYINYMKNILIGNVTEKNYDERKMFLDNLYNMTLIEIDVLAYVYNRHEEITASEIIIEDVDSYVISGAVSKLKGYGFVSTSIATVSIGYTDEYVKITQYGKKFLDFIIE